MQRGKLQLTMRLSSFLHLYLFVMGAVFLGGDARGSIVIDGFAPEKHDRFANAPSFIGATFDWSGVGRSSSGQWATMVTDQYFLSAYHARPSGTLTFYPGNDPSVAAISESVASGTRIGLTDLYLGQLANPLPGSIASYAVPGLEVADSPAFMSSGYYLETIYTAGNSETTAGYGADPVTNMAVGRNLMDMFFPDFDQLAGSVTDAVGFIHDPPISPSWPDRFIEDESFVQGGDSGGPSFVVDDNNDLLLVGIHWFIGTLEDENGDPLAEVSGDNFVPNYIADLNALMTTGSITESDFIVAVPEPSELSAAGVMVGFLLVCSRWRRAGKRRSGSRS